MRTHPAPPSGSRPPKNSVQEDGIEVGQTAREYAEAQGRSYDDRSTDAGGDWELESAPSNNPKEERMNSL